MLIALYSEPGMSALRIKDLIGSNTTPYINRVFGLEDYLSLYTLHYWYLGE
jgi:hypothetical protein